MRKNILAQVRRFVLRLALCLATAQAAASPIPVVAAETQAAASQQQQAPAKPAALPEGKDAAPVGMGWG